MLLHSQQYGRGRAWRAAARPDIFACKVRIQLDVNIFENSARRDATQSVGRFDEVIAYVAEMLATESVDEEERFGELSSFDQKARAINIPF